MSETQAEVAVQSMSKWFEAELKNFQSSIHQRLSEITGPGSIQGSGKTVRKGRVSVGGTTTEVAGPKVYKRNMACRAPGCTNISKGPRYSFFCEEHVTLPDDVKSFIKQGLSVKDAERAASSVTKGKKTTIPKGKKLVH
jgi:hypothetical protein